MNKRMINYLAVAVLLLGLAACGGSSGGGGGAGLNGATSVTGTVYSASGDPVPGTTVYIPGATVSAMTVNKATRSFNKAVVNPDGTSCEDPLSGDNAQASACAGQDGSFNIDTSALTSGTQIVFQRGALRMIMNLNCTSSIIAAGVCTLPTTDTSFGGGSTTWPRVAVVTGLWDRMEDVLAKLADSNTTDDTNGQYGRVDASTGIFVYGSEYGTNLTIIDGTGFTTPTENVDNVGTYKTWNTYLDGTNPLVSGGAPVFDIIFINCGNSYEATQLIPNIATLQAYVNAGGRLYVTDLSYDHIEQSFPQFMQFANDPADPDTPGVLGAAEVGSAVEPDGVTPLTVNAAVNEAGMATWLADVNVNRHDATTPGNPDFDCAAAPYDQITSALTTNSLIPLGDFLGGWAHMDGAHTGYTPTIWISSGTGVVFNGLTNRPLTASMSSGANGGLLVYSSYHTAHSCPTPTFWPQERVLQYLIFEAF
ncbi:MAG: hypothetical protein ABH859_08610 [Pseudomonadota bacterium]